MQSLRFNRVHAVSIFAVILVGVAIGAAAPVGTDAPDIPRNVIVLIGDGMGFEQLKAASLYAHGRDGELVIQQLPRKGQVRTEPAEGPQFVTDSAAAATAMATGRKVNHGVVSLAVPGDGSPLRTALEYWRDRGKATGLVTTAFITHATPAGFGGHAQTRHQYDRIARSYLMDSRPNVLFGGICGNLGKSGDVEGMTRQKAEIANYRVVSTRDEMMRLKPQVGIRVSGQFGSGHMPFEYDYLSGVDKEYDTLPHLSEMTAKALEILAVTGEGFFLMVESGRIDHAGHNNEISRNIHETIEFDKTVAGVLRWARERKDTLLLVTADHETGGLAVVRNEGKGREPIVSWSFTHHSRVNVPLFALGPGSQRVDGILDNTELFGIMTAQADKGISPDSASKARVVPGPATDALVTPSR